MEDEAGLRNVAGEINVVIGTSIYSQEHYMKP